jgi:type IV pilus assembly protein PilA
MLNKLAERSRDEKGFTLIELLVVILIIGILAAIALPAFLGQRQKAQDTSAKSEVRNAVTAMETYYTDNEKYDGGTQQALHDIEPSIPASGGGFSVLSATGQGYELQSTSATGTTFRIKKDAATGLSTRSCTGTSAGCKNNSSW